LITKGALLSFDLKRGPLVGVILVKLDREEFILLFRMHHIVSDGWSMGVLVHEVTAFYEAFHHRRPAPLLPKLSIQYADYAIQQRELMQGARLEAELDYWRRQLSGMPAALELPYDRPYPEEQIFRGARQPFTLSAELLQSLRTLSNQEGATLFMTLLAAFQALLYCYSKQENIVIGTDLANR